MNSNHNGTSITLIKKECKDDTETEQKLLEAIEACCQVEMSLPLGGGQAGYKRLHLYSKNIGT